MNGTDYIQGCLRSASSSFHSPSNKKEKQLLHAALGLSTESGELLDCFKKHIYYGKPLDVTNIIEELGDACWYISLALSAIGMSWEDLFAINIAKLRSRYPEKFTSERALVRDLPAEIQTIADAVNGTRKETKE